MQREELAAWLRLLLTPGLGRGPARRLLKAFGPPELIWAAPPAAWREVVDAPQVAAMADEPEDFAQRVDAHERWLQAQGHHLLVLGDPRFPDDLLHTADPPLALFVLGQPEALTHPGRIAVVGSRNPTPQGLENARAFGQAFAEAGLCVVSGLALGIDGAAHAGALDGGGPTLAVVGTGLDRVYPSQHRALAHRIATQGALVSEYALGAPPLAEHFPQRNRLIAGMSLGTLVVEATLGSGSLITARLASEQGREVFAIPGSIHSAQSRGCHSLIRQGARLVESVQDVLEELRLPGPGATTAPPSDEPIHPLLAAMGHEPVSLDTLQARTGLDTARLQAQLLELELAGDVARLPGGLVQRLTRA